MICRIINILKLLIIDYKFEFKYLIIKIIIKYLCKLLLNLQKVGKIPTPTKV